MFVRIVVILISVVHFRTKISGQVCVQKKINWRNVPETYIYTYLEAYENSDCLFWCTDTRVASAVGTRTVKSNPFGYKIRQLRPIYLRYYLKAANDDNLFIHVKVTSSCLMKQVAEHINVCCDGYKEEKSHTNNSIHCKPICTPPCINGYCQSPDVCSCSPGYLPDIFESHKCIPLCLKGCQHGICTAPNTCECDSRYKSVNDKCEPICTEECENGICVAPDTCQCTPGFKKSDKGVCEVYCSSFTTKGECIGTIICEPGWEKVIKGSLEECQPVCTEACFNGICIAPETCKCLDGYVKSAFGDCEPYCSSGCPQGSCISPDTCVCEPGWYKNQSNGECLPHCDHSCENGSCIAPNVCQCFPGFLHHESNDPMCIPICENCKERCLSIDNCTCEWDHIPLYVTSNGLPCDCLENCSDIENKCERTTCVINTSIIVLDGESIITTKDPFDDTLSTATTVEYNAMVDHDNNDYYELKIDKASWFTSIWFYGIGFAALTSLTIMLIVAILKKKCIFTKFLPNDPVCVTSAPVVHYKQNSMT